MSPIRFTNITQYSHPRTIYLWIEKSADPSRIGRHEIKTQEDFIIGTNEEGHIENWLHGDVPFYHGDEDAWVIARKNFLSIANLRAFTRPERKAIKRKSKTLEGLNISFLPITKESLG